jgi:ABC-type Fe3+ transport system permease subunit
MRWLKQLFRKLRKLKYFILPAATIALQIFCWRRADVQHRAIFCSLTIITIVLSFIWWQTNRRQHSKRQLLHRHRHHRDDYR